MMLLELRAENYTVIERAQVQFGPGLNLLTGETGAGKSILIDALVLLLGGKASSDVVRHGEERAVLSCVFETTPAAEAVLTANGIDSEDEAILIRREITVAGKGRVFLNNQPATVSVLRQLAPELALIHAQGETTSSFDAAQQRGLLDRFSATDLTATTVAFGSWQEVASRLRTLEMDGTDRQRQADLWRFQASEIHEGAVASEDEDRRLEGEKRVLSNAERLYTAAKTAGDLLYEAEDSTETTLGAALKQVEELSRFDDSFVEVLQQLSSAKSVVEDAATTLRTFAENVGGSPDRLAEIEDRLAALERLKRKYGPSLAEVIAFGCDAAKKLDEIDSSDTMLADLRAERSRLEQIYRLSAEQLSAARQTAATKLTAAAERAIGELAMRAKLGIQVRPQPEQERSWSSYGWDDVTFLIATNPGEPLKPLDEVASGGEMSRVMLALKVSVEEQARTRRSKPTGERSLIFDEIDVGIGGRAAEAVGQKLKALAKGQQVLALSDADRREEIARMLSGAKLTETSLRHADHLLAESR